MTSLPLLEPFDDRPTLLIVDDDLTFCEVLSRAMSRRGFSVHIQSNRQPHLPKHAHPSMQPLTYGLLAPLDLSWSNGCGL
jgi:ActR/RegA family two-component response regulator